LVKLLLAVSTPATAAEAQWLFEQVGGNEAEEEVLATLVFAHTLELAEQRVAGQARPRSRSRSRGAPR
jgi:hypothetical protein